MNSRDDDLVLLLAGIFFGPILLAAFLKPVRDLFVQWHILVTENVLIPFGEGVGLDLPRVVIALSIVGALITLAVIVFRRHVAKKESEAK
jgi:hypothetical protein